MGFVTGYYNTGSLDLPFVSTCRMYLILTSPLARERGRFKDSVLANWAHNRILCRASKHGQDSLLPLTVPMGESLLEYQKKAHPPSADSHVFLTSRSPYHALLDSNARSATVKRYPLKPEIQISSKGAHAFRHGFAIRVFQEGHSFKAVADVLGHPHLGTFIYTQVDFNSLRQVALPWLKEVAP